ncbi:MAG TPA: 50S ribosomal protein L24 [Gemmatales bacterium]|nr:50S ribosomal protein L24 [Lacipirellulaceae bacterium]HMP60060.1 50S ribosomal protein L24 [Gemmatales bacterium]
MFVRKNDTVVIRCGEDSTRGKTTVHRVLRVIPDTNQVVVEGVNQVVKHIKPNRRNPKGGRLTKEMPFDASRVMLYCPACQKGVRVGRRQTADGGKERYCKKCGNAMGALARPKKKAT